MGLACRVAPNFSNEAMTLLVQVRLVRVVNMSKAAFDELDGTHNTLMMWEHFGGIIDWLG